MTLLHLAYPERSGLVLLVHGLELAQHLSSDGHRTPDRRDLHKCPSVHQLSHPGSGERGRRAIPLERRPSDQTCVLELPERLSDGGWGHAELSGQAIDGQRFTRGNLAVQEHLQDRVVDAVSKHPALDANLGTGGSHPSWLGCRHDQRSYIMYEICFGAHMGQSEAGRRR